MSFCNNFTYLNRFNCFTWLKQQVINSLTQQIINAYEHMLDNDFILISSCTFFKNFKYTLLHNNYIARKSMSKDKPLLAIYNSKNLGNSSVNFLLIKEVT